MNTLGQFIETVNRYLWGLPMILLLFGTHLFLTWKTGFIQRRLPLAIRLSLTRDKSASGDISPFAALSTSLASTLGTGNIIGVGTAIALGGPGAVFWCWLTGVFGIATTYAESLIAIKYRVRTSDGTMLGGAMYALERGLGLKPLGILFACFGVLTSFGIGCGVQVNAISAVVETSILDALKGAGTLEHSGVLKHPGALSSSGTASLPSAAAFLAQLLEKHPDAVALAVGIVTGLVTCAVILGGVRSISRVCERLVPFMALFYILGCAVLLYLNRGFLPEAFSVILRSAFTETGALAGGMAGSGIMLAARFGIARGLFSNEAGMGSAPIIAAAARSRNPVRQALIASTATFWDTVVMCLITGLVLVSSLLSQSPQAAGSAAGASHALTQTALSGGELTTMAFSRIPYLGRPVLIIGIITFAYATILGWSYYGERCLEYLFGKISLFPYRFLWIFVLVFAPVIRLELIWSISDTLNALMALPNLIAVLLLSDVIAKDTRYYLKHLDEEGS